MLGIFGMLVTRTETVCWIFLVRWRLGQKQFVGYFWCAGDWDRNSLFDIYGTLVTGTETVGYFWHAGDWDRNSLLDIFGTLVTGTETVCWMFLGRWRTLATGTETVCWIILMRW